MQQHWYWAGVAVGLGAAVAVGFGALGVGVVTMASNDVLVAIETAFFLTALLAAFLMMGRHGSGGAPRDALLAIALTVVAASAGIAWWLQVGAGTAAPATGAWELATTRLLAAMVFLLAAAVRRPWLGRHPRLLWIIGGLSALAVTATIVQLRMVATGQAPVLEWAAFRTGIVVAEALGSVIFLAAAIGFARSARHANDTFLWFVAAAAGLLSLSRLSYLFYPSIYLDHLYVGDAYRGLAFAVLLAGALFEVRRSWEQVAADSLLAERRRIARQLHDGVAHETAFISSAVRGLPRGERSPELVAIAEAAERALDEARRVIHVYTAPPEEPLDRLLVSFAEQIANRAGARVRADCESGIRTDAEVAEALSRIVRESVTNAVRHGHADLIELGLFSNGHLRLTVRDNGTGFDGSSLVPVTGFGLISMRERTEALGGSFRITSTPGGGTNVEVDL